MRLKKALTGSALSLALLVSATPAFATTSSSTNTTPEAKALETCTTKPFGPYYSRNEIPNFINDGVKKWYLKGVSSWDGVWYGYYESCN
ncbi:LCI fold-containing protein [Bacillus tequilensis]|uniref:LCI fold domain-containing protein n=1 Tax=Bacillus tequilensis TaxID=227866 RepID=A0A6H0WKN3_9BACI|nr:LCI fold-containing protein [Bacillus tequilensis]QIW79916.1 hypothetical protein G4P54_08885 [Bacillus tequilensis]